jgi:hypothetical protein
VISIRLGFLAALGLVACGDDDAADDDDDTTAGSADDDDDDDDATGADTSSTGDPPPSAGPLACPEGESCTIVVVSQALDDRVEIFTARGPGEPYRGAIDLDLKPNPMGDNEGEYLDEPFGLSLDADGLAVLVGHYPARDLGSMVVFPHDTLAMFETGTTIPQSAFFADGAFTSAVRAGELGEEEPIFVLRHPSGRLLVAAFENDLFTPELEWTAPGKLLVIDPADPSVVGKRTLDDLENGSCAGAWSIVALDDSMDTVALSCDGNDGAAVLDVSGIGNGSVEDAAAAVTGCIADTIAPDKKVRSIAPDGQGGFLLVEHGQVADGTGKFFRFGSDCALLGQTPFDGLTVFEVRDVVRLATGAGTRWLLASGLTPDRGVHVVRDGETGTEVCNKLELDDWFTGTDGTVLDPYALTLDRAHTGLAVGVAAREAQSDAPAAGRVLWVELDPAIDPCAASPVVEVVDLADSGPAVDPDDPATWRRGPNVVLVQEYGP